MLTVWIELNESFFETVDQTDCLLAGSTCLLLVELRNELFIAHHLHPERCQVRAHNVLMSLDALQQWITRRPLCKWLQFGAFSCEMRQAQCVFLCDFSLSISYFWRGYFYLEASELVDYWYWLSGCRLVVRLCRLPCNLVVWWVSLQAYERRIVNVCHLSQFRFGVRRQVKWMVLLFWAAVLQGVRDQASQVGHVPESGFYQALQINRILGIDFRRICFVECNLDIVWFTVKTVVSRRHLWFTERHLRLVKIWHHPALILELQTL